MSTINIFPNTNIVVNGDVPYTFTSNDTGHLNHVEVKPKVSSESINVNLSGISFESVAIEDGTDLGEHTLQWITTSRTAQTWSTVQNRTLTCDDSIKDTYMTELRFLVSKGYNISGVQQIITGLSITTYMSTISEFGEYNITAEVTGPSGAVYDLQWTATSDIPVSGMSIVKTGALTSKFIFRPGTIDVYNENEFTVTVTDTISGLTAYIPFKDSIYPRATISGPSSITDSGTYQYTGYKNVNDNVLGPQSEVASGNNVRFSLSNAPSGVTIDSSSGVLTVPDNIDSTFDVQVRIEFNIGYIYDINASMSVTAYTVVPQARTVTYDLNNNWQVSTYQHPSDATGMAMFMSGSNHNVNSSTATMYIRYSASNTVSNVNVYICSNSEPRYDYTKIYALDSESTVVTDTSNHQGFPNGLLSTNYVLQTYIIPGDNQTHFIRIDYYKDNVAHRGEDRGFVCVAPSDGLVIDPYVPLEPISSIDISEVVYIGNGTYEFDVEIGPANADPDDLRWDNWYTCRFTSGYGDIGSTWTDTGFGTKKTKGHMYFTGLISNSGQFGIVLKSATDPTAFDEEVVTVGEVW